MSSGLETGDVLQSNIEVEKFSSLEGNRAISRDQTYNIPAPGNLTAIKMQARSLSPSTIFCSFSHLITQAPDVCDC